MRSSRPYHTLLFIVLLPAGSLFFGCSFDYEQAKVAEDLSERVPQTVLIDFTQVRVYKGVPDYRIYGTRAETFDKKKETVAQDILFQEFDDSGKIVTEGEADKIVLFSESDDAELTGNVRFYNSKEEAGVKADYLSWKDQDKRLSGKPDEPVEIEKKDGSKVTGTGFDADFTTKTVRFSSHVGGTWVDKDEKEDKSTP